MLAQTGDGYSEHILQTHLYVRSGMEIQCLLFWQLALTQESVKENVEKQLKHTCAGCQVGKGNDCIYS